MEPLKPFDNATFFIGKFDQSILPFLPAGSPYREFIRVKESVVCRKHIMRGEEKFIASGDRVVAVKWTASGDNGQELNKIAFYCSVACQREHALQLQYIFVSKKRRQAS